jgi:hypothetical protein
MWFARIIASVALAGMGFLLRFLLALYRDQTFRCLPVKHTAEFLEEPANAADVSNRTAA